MKDNFYSKQLHNIYQQTTKERLYYKNKDIAVTDPILQRTNNYIPSQPKPNYLYQQYSTNIQPKPVKPYKNYLSHTPSEIIYSDNAGKAEILKQTQALKGIAEMKKNYKLRSSQQKLNGIKVFPHYNNESSLQYLFTVNDLNKVNNNNSNNTLKKTKSITSLSSCKPMHNTFTRIFPSGGKTNNDAHLSNGKSCGYKATKYKKAKYDNLNDIIINQSKIKEKSNYAKKQNEIAIKPNNVSYSYMIEQNKKNWHKRMHSDYY